MTVPCVAQVVLSFGRGGLETMAVGLAAALVTRGIRSVIVALDEGGPLSEQLHRAGVEQYVLGGRRLRDPRSYWRFAHLLRQIGPAVVHSHNFAALLHTAVARRLAGVPRMVHTEHAWDYISSTRLRPWIWAAGHACDSFVVVGDRLLPFYRDRVHIAASRLRVIPNGVNLEEFRPHSDVRAARRALGLPDGFLIGSAGRLAPEKELSTLLRAAAEIRRVREDVQLVLLGEGVERPALEKLAEELDLRGCVHFLGWRDDVARVVSTYDLFVLSSSSEGLPLALLEAMAAGVPVASTPVGDVPSVIHDGVSGRFFPVGDYAALATIALALAADPEARGALGRSARRAVEAGYGHGVMVNRYLNAYGIEPGLRDWKGDGSASAAVHARAAARP